MLRNRMFLATAGGHFAVDVLNSTGAVLLAFLAVPWGLSKGEIATALTIYLLVGSLSQPLFGYLADRLPGQGMLLAAGGVVWMVVCYALVAVAPSWGFLLAAFLLAPLGSALFHPIGTTAASRATPERASSATAIFFFFGQIGLALGPALTGLLTDVSGKSGLLPLALAGLLPAGLLFLATRDEKRVLAREREAQATITPVRVALIVLVAFVVLVAVRSSIQQIYASFLPLLFSDRGWDATVYGALAGTFMAAAAVGNMFTGDVADRFGMRAATVWPLLLSVPAGLICFLTQSIWATFAACALAGILVGGQHSVLVVHAQRLMPVKQGFAAGLILGFTFASGALGTWLAGQFADVVGLQPVMLWATLLGLPAALLALTLPGRPRAVVAPVPAPAGD